MIISEFKTLRNAIVNSCNVIDGVVDIEKNYRFKIDFAKMENILNQKKTGLHVLAFDKFQESFEPGLNEIQLISEYIKSDKDFERIFNGKTNIVYFMLYYRENADGEVNIYNDKDDIMTDKQIFEACNGDFNHINPTIILNIVKDLPVFRVLVERSFDFSADKFKYRVYFRQNNEMSIFYESLKNKTEEDKNEETVEE